MKSNVPSTQETLLVAVCRDPLDDRAWGRFVFVYGPLILDWCRRYGLQDADARDVVQDVLLQFSKQAARFRYDGSKKFRGYLRSITHAAWCDWVGSRSAGSEGTGDSRMTRLLEQAPARDDLVARLESEFDRERLDLAMESIKRRVEPQTWEAFRLLAIEDLSGAEAASRLGMRIGSTFAAKHRVQRLIKEAIDDLGD